MKADIANILRLEEWKDRKDLDPCDIIESLQQPWIHLFKNKIIMSTSFNPFLVCFSVTC